MADKKQQMVILEGDGTFQIEVAGESHYFKELKGIAGSCANRDVEVIKTAYLVPEPRNPNDPNAVKVIVDQKLVGYLPRSTAAQLSPVLQKANLAAVELQARISGFEGANNYSVWLDGNLAEVITTYGASKPWWRFGR